MGDVLVRPAREDEFVVIGEVTVAAYRQQGTLDGETGGYADLLRDAGRRAQAGDLLVAVDESDAVLGSVTIVWPNSSYCELARAGEMEFRMLAVAPDAQGRGVGAALTNAVLERARGHGLHRVVMSSEQHMHTAHRLYERLGFTRLPARDWQPAVGIQLHGFVREL